MVIKGMITAPFIMLESLYVAVDGNFKMNIDILAKAGGRAAGSFEATSIPQFSMGGLVIQAGPVPISIDAYLALKTKGSYSLDAAGTATVVSEPGRWSGGGGGGGVGLLCQESNRPSCFAPALELHR